MSGHTAANEAVPEIAELETCPERSRRIKLNLQSLVSNFHFSRRMQMSNYSLEEIIKRWGRGDLTTEQAIGQILLVVQNLSRRVGKLEQQAEAQRSRKSGPPNASRGK